MAAHTSAKISPQPTDGQGALRIDLVAAQDFLSFHRMHLDVRAGLNVITGPNGAGKSNLCTVVDVVRMFLSPRDQAWSDRMAKYEEAGRNGARRFTLSLGITLDQAWEHDLVRDFVRASVICTAAGGNDDRLWRGATCGGPVGCAARNCLSAP